MEFSFSLKMPDQSALGEARRMASHFAREMELDETKAGQAAIIAAEIATNLAKHASGGEIMFSPLRSEKRFGLEILALDRGAGIADIPRAMKDGFSTAGSPGTGLGAMARLADEFDIFSETAGKITNGTAIMARLWNTAPVHQAANTNKALEIGAICLPYPGETLCGDHWSVRHSRQLDGEYLDILVADGIGHGLQAYEASSTAVRIFNENTHAAPPETLNRIHAALRATRGAAVAVMQIRPDKQTALFTGVGNIAGAIIHDASSRGLASHNGLVGHQMHKSQEFHYPFMTGSTVILHSDGLGTRWNALHYPGLKMRHAGLIAGVLYRDFQRGRDDATILVVTWRDGLRRVWS